MNPRLSPSNNLSDAHPVKLHRLGLLVDDPAELGQWYEKYLGLAVTTISDDCTVVVFGKGGTLAFRKGAAQGRRNTIRLSLEVNDVDAMCRLLRQRGAHPDQGPSDGPWGSRFAAFRDPAGHIVEMISPRRQPRWMTDVPEPGDMRG